MTDQEAPLSEATVDTLGTYRLVALTAVPTGAVYAARVVEAFLPRRLLEYDQRKVSVISTI